MKQTIIEKLDQEVGYEDPQTKNKKKIGKKKWVITYSIILDNIR